MNRVDEFDINLELPNAVPVLTTRVPHDEARGTSFDPNDVGVKAVELLRRRRATKWRRRLSKGNN